MQSDEVYECAGCGGEVSIIEARWLPEDIRRIIDPRPYCCIICFEQANQIKELKMMEADEATTGDWLRQLSKVVDSKDRQIREQAQVINNMTHNRLVVGWLHPNTKRFIYDDVKKHAIKIGSKSAIEYRGYTTPVFIQLKKP
jgi:hypothetical protein